MSANFHEDTSHAQPSLPSDRATGLVFAVASAAIGLIYRNSDVVLFMGLAFSSMFLGASLLAPAILHPLNIAWFRLGQLLHKIVGPAVTGALFLLVILPFGLCMRIRYDPLRLKAGRKRKSYWIERKTDAVRQSRQDSMKNQF